MPPLLALYYDWPPEVEARCAQAWVNAMPALPAVIRQINPDELYGLASRHGLEYGPEFRSVSGVAVAGPADAQVALGVPPLA